VLLGSKKNFFENFPDFSFRIGWWKTLWNTVLLCTNCYTMWKKINMHHSFWIQKNTCNDPASWQLYFENSRLLYSLQKTYCTNHRYVHVTTWQDLFTTLCI
jgi:hypothetical protein